MNITKYTQVSPAQLISIQYFAFISAVIGAFLVEWSVALVMLSVVFYYIFMVIGIGVVLHRYYSHKTFEFRNNFLKWLFTFVAVISSRGSPITWVHVHREHHAYSDTELDPHRPTTFTWFGFKKAGIQKFKPFLVKDLLLKEQKIIHDYYLLFIIAWCTILLILDPALFYFAWVVPVVLTQCVQDIWNYWSHVNSGYRNFETKDNSRNLIWLWPFIFGEAWHNNHHGRPSSLTTKLKTYELDPVLYLISIIKK